MPSYYRVMASAGSKHATECFTGGFIGADYDIHQDLTGKLPDQWVKFNQQMIPVFLSIHPDKTRIAAGLACGTLWTVAKGIQKGDWVLTPDGAGNYRPGEVVGDYYYAPDGPLQHRRAIHWLDTLIPRASMSLALRNSTGSIATVGNITAHSAEIEALIGARPQPAVVATDATIEDAATFALEKHLEDFLVQNWKQTDLGKDYLIYEDGGTRIGQQYPTDTGPIDILAVRHDRKELLVVELKRGRASDVVVGQILRYMGYVLGELATDGQTVRGVIIALEDDQKLRRALAVTPAVDFYRYTVSFKLHKS